MQRSKQLLCATVCVGLVTGLVYVAKANAFDIEAGKKATVKGSIVSRSGDLVKVRTKDQAVVVVDLTDSTQIERTKDFRFRHKDMDVTALVPGLNIEAEGVGNAQGQLQADKIKFDPDEFAIEVAEEQQIQANSAAAKKAQSTADSGVKKANGAQASANEAQSSADTAQASADQAQSTADAAGAVGVMDAAAVAKVNKRVSDLGEYKKVAEAGIYFPSNGTTLDDAAKADLSQLASIALPLQGYMIEVAGYASSTGSKQWDQKLGSERAAAVTQYLRDQKNIPMRRILAPASYGATHPAATNSDPEGRALNRRVDVTVLVNKGLQE
ncbi:MAG: OmpA family protein [Acidobacteriaceae bacterium]|nr:OmpA family protein [Acidobacteriaceae bacterium]